MSSDQTNSKPDLVPDGGGNSSLEWEAKHAYESRLFFALFGSARRYLVALTTYLAAATALVTAGTGYFSPVDNGRNVVVGTLASILALPLLLAFYFNLRPALERVRECRLRPVGSPKPDYFIKESRKSDPYNLFPPEYERFLTWTRHPPKNLLHLTGASGAGKSSLIDAYLTPRLAMPENGNLQKATVITIREYDDPLGRLKSELRHLWRTVPSDFPQLSPLETLRRAERLFDSNKRLLIVFDQFEELLLTRVDSTAQETGGIVTPSRARMGDNLIAQVCELLKTIVSMKEPIRFAVVLSYRHECHYLLEPLALPPLANGVNWMKLNAFQFSQAETFLCGGGISIPKERLHLVFREAAQYEHELMRPIIANLFGLVLQRMVSHPTLWRSKGELLCGYVKECLRKDLSESRGLILKSLLAEGPLIRPRSVTRLSNDTGLSVATLTGDLPLLSADGLIRCVNRSHPDPLAHEWQIAHSFLCPVIERALPGRRTVWQRTRSWVLATVTLLIVAACIVGPWLRKLNAVQAVTSAGFVWDDSARKLAVNTTRTDEITSLENIAGPIRILDPLILDLSHCRRLESIDALQHLKSVQTLDLSKCILLQNVDSLRQVKSLRNIDLTGCWNLRNADALKDHKGLTRLSLWSCRKLASLDFLSGLSNLEHLQVSEASLKDTNALKELWSLEHLEMVECPNLENIDDLRSLKSLRYVSLAKCTGLKKLDGLKSVPLELLDLSGCNQLTPEQLQEMQLVAGELRHRQSDP